MTERRTLRGAAPKAPFLSRVSIPTRAGRLQMDTQALRARVAAVLPLPSRAAGLIALDAAECAVRGLPFGSYRDLQGNVRNVADEVAQIRADESALRAADHGLGNLTREQRAFMRLRVDLLDRVEASRHPIAVHIAA